MLAGIGSVQANCGRDALDRGADAGYLGPAECNTIFGYTWWIVWLQLAVLLGITFSIVKGVERWRAPALGYLAIASVLTMDTANTYIYFNSTPVNNHSAARATAAGAVICSIGNLALMTCVGLLEEKEIIGPKPMAVPKSSIPSAVI
ncbi:hypothetical protein ACKKBF_B40050 [Auxenochlorella protothecoides x Auxenochlorella symbiontica]